MIIEFSTSLMPKKVFQITRLRLVIRKTFSSICDVENTILTCPPHSILSIPLNKLPCSSVCGLVLGLYHTTLLKILQWEAYCQIIWFALLNPFKSYLTSKTIDASERKRDNSKCFKSELSSSNRDNSDSDTRTFFFKSAVKKTRIMDIFFFVRAIHFLISIFFLVCLY